MFFRVKVEYFGGKSIEDLNTSCVQNYYLGDNQGFISRVEKYKNYKDNNICTSEIMISHTIGLDKVEGDVILEHSSSTGESLYNTLSLSEALREYLQSIDTDKKWECRIIHPHNASIIDGDFVVEFTLFNMDGSISDVFHLEGINNNFLVENCLITESYRTENGRYYSTRFDPEWIKSIVLPIVQSTVHVSKRYNLPGKKYSLSVVTYKHYEFNKNSIVIPIDSYLDSPRNYPYHNQKIYLKEIVLSPVDMSDKKDGISDELMDFIKYKLPTKREIPLVGYSSLINIYSSIAHDLAKKFGRYYSVYFIDQKGNHIIMKPYDFVSGKPPIPNSRELIQAIFDEFHGLIGKIAEPE